MINQFQAINFLRKYEVIVASAVVLLVLTAASFLFLLPNFNRARLIFGQKSQLQKRLDKLQQKNNALSDLDVKYYEHALTGFYRILPDGKDFISLFETLDRLEKKANVTVSSTVFELGSLSKGMVQLKKVKGGTAYILPISINIQGDLSSIEKYLEALDDFSGRIITVDSISMQMSKIGVYGVSLTGNTFIAPSSGEIGSLDSVIPKINKTQQELLDKIAKLEIDTYQPAVAGKVPVGKKNLFD